MKRASDYFILTYTVLASAFSLTLYLLNETRIDAYVATNILVYYVCYAITRPTQGRSLVVKVYNVLLLLIVGAIIAIRVYEVLRF